MSVTILNQDVLLPLFKSQLQVYAVDHSARESAVNPQEKLQDESNLSHHGHCHLHLYLHSFHDFIGYY